MALKRKFVSVLEIFRRSIQYRFTIVSGLRNWELVISFIEIWVTWMGAVLSVKMFFLVHIVVEHLSGHLHGDDEYTVGYSENLERK